MNAAQKQTAGFLGLCMRAGQVTTGQDGCVEMVRGGRAAIVLLDEGASENTRKRVTDACRSHSVPGFALEEGLLGRSIGRETAMTAALPAGGMADKLLKILENENRL